MGKRTRRRNRSARSATTSRGAGEDRRSRREALIGRIEKQAVDAAVPPERLAGSLLDFYEGQHVPGELAFEIVREASAQRARDVARAVLELEPTSLPALTLAASVAEALREDDECVRYYRKAVEVSPDPMTRWCYVAALQGAERNADALDLLEELCCEDPMEWGTDPLYRDSLVEAFRRRTRLSAEEVCPCGGGGSYADCCRPREAVALDRFLDRSIFDELRQAIVQYAMASKDVEPMLAAAWRRWFGDGNEPEADEGEVRLFTEWTWTYRGFEEEADGEEKGGCVLRCFSEDPGVPAALRRRARRWMRTARWGLWMIKDPAPTPGVWMLDLLTGTAFYASMPPEQIDGLGPWTVILGALVPVEGVWRTGGAFLPMSPGTGDRLADAIVDIIDKVARQVVAKGIPRYDPYEGLPACVAAERMGRVEEPVCHFISSVVGSALPDLVGFVREWGRTLPRLRNMEGHPLLLVKAEIAVRDPDALLRCFQDHPDFRVYEGEIVWMGRQMTSAEAATSLAEFKAQARKEGIDPEDLKPSNRWSRGTVGFNGSTLILDTNSVERLEMFLEILEALGAEPEVVARPTVDPAEERAHRRTHPSGAAGADHGGMSPEALDAWARTWPDEAVPALEGMTPRQAARDDRGSILLEALLRDLEHRAAANRARGVDDVDVAELRATLGVDEDVRPRAGASRSS